VGLTATGLIDADVSNEANTGTKTTSCWGVVQTRALPMPLQAPKPLPLQMSARAGGQHRLPWINRSPLLCWNLWGMNPRAND
jgi:hypothetical protein